MTVPPDYYTTKVMFDASFQHEETVVCSILLENVILSENEAQEKRTLELIASTTARYGIIAEGESGSMHVSRAYA